MLKFDKKSKFTVYLADTLSVINMKYDNVSLSFYTDGNFKLELVNSYDKSSFELTKDIDCATKSICIRNDVPLELMNILVYKEVLVETLNMVMKDDHMYRIYFVGKRLKELLLANRKMV